jgi:hypothetical protein
VFLREVLEFRRPYALASVWIGLNGEWEEYGVRGSLRRFPEERREYRCHVVYELKMKKVEREVWILYTVLAGRSARNRPYKAQMTKSSHTVIATPLQETPPFSQFLPTAHTTHDDALL